MRRWQILAIAVVICGFSESALKAQQPPLPRMPAIPTYRFQVTPQAGEWLVCVQTFRGEGAKNLAEEMAEVLIRDYKLPAYLHDRSYKERAEEQQRVQALRDKHWDNIEKLEAQGIEAIDRRLRYRSVEIPDQFAVLVGKPNRPLKDMEAARDFLDDLRKLKAPPSQFSATALIEKLDANGKKVTGTGLINPFMTAMVVHNPSIPLKSEQANPEVADAFLKELNANEPMSVLKCSKPWTLVVKMYQGQAVLQSTKSPSIMQRLGLSKKEPELLNASAAQAHATAEFLRKMNPSFESYIMHHRSYSLVLVGQYDSPNDPNLLANQKSLAGLQIKNPGTGSILETLNAQPLPMKIPR